MANLRAVLQDQEPWRLVDEDPDQHSHPLFRMSLGMKMLGARGREGIKRYRRRNERFLRNEILYFHEIRQTPFQKVETYTNPPTEPTHGRETDGRRQTRKPGPRTRHQEVLHKEDTERQHECDRPKGHKTYRFVTKSQHPRAQASGARRRRRSTIPPSRTADDALP